MCKAVIATRVPGLTDYLLDGETGILVEAGNHIAVAEAVDWLWGNPEKTSRMGQRAREWVEATFSLDKWLDDISNLLLDELSA